MTRKCHNFDCKPIHGGMAQCEEETQNTDGSITMKMQDDCYQET